MRDLLFSSTNMAAMRQSESYLYLLHAQWPPKYVMDKFTEQREPKAYNLTNSDLNVKIAVARKQLRFHLKILPPSVNAFKN